MSRYVTMNNGCDNDESRRVTMGHGMSRWVTACHDWWGLAFLLPPLDCLQLLVPPQLLRQRDLQRVQTVRRALQVRELHL